VSKNAGDAIHKADTVADLESIALFARTVIQEWPICTKGYPAKNDLKFLIRSLYISYRSAGGEAASYYVNSKRGYRGGFLCMHLRGMGFTRTRGGMIALE
jgi:hypothetical protein